VREKSKLVTYKRAPRLPRLGNSHPCKKRDTSPSRDHEPLSILSKLFADKQKSCKLGKPNFILNSIAGEKKENLY